MGDLFDASGRASGRGAGAVFRSCSDISNNMRPIHFAHDDGEEGGKKGRRRGGSRDERRLALRATARLEGEGGGDSSSRVMIHVSCICDQSSDYLSILCPV